MDKKLSFCLLQVIFVTTVHKEIYRICANIRNWQLNSLLHLGKIVITFRTLLHLGSFITFRPLQHHVASLTKK